MPLALDLAKSEEALLLLSRRHRSGCHRPRLRNFAAHRQRPFADPARRLRQDLTDPEFVAEAKKANLDINPLTGEEVKKLVDDLFKLNPTTKSKLVGTLIPK